MLVLCFSGSDFENDSSSSKIAIRSVCIIIIAIFIWAFLEFHLFLLVVFCLFFSVSDVCQPPLCWKMHLAATNQWCHELAGFYGFIMFLWSSINWCWTFCFSFSGFLIWCAVVHFRQSILIFVAFLEYSILCCGIQLRWQSDVYWSSCSSDSIGFTIRLRYQMRGY